MAVIKTRYIAPKKKKEQKEVLVEEKKAEEENIEVELPEVDTQVEETVEEFIASLPKKPKKKYKIVE